MTLLQLGPHAFDEIGGEIVQTASFIIRKTNFEEYKEKFKELTPYKSEKEKEVNFFIATNEFIAKKRDSLSNCRVYQLLLGECIIGRRF